MLTDIIIEGLEVHAIIGCLPSEREQPQGLRLDLKLSLDADPAADADDPSLTWDYGDMADTAAFVLRRGRFLLLETAARFVLRALLLPPMPHERRPAAVAAELTLRKPDALPGTGIAGVALRGAPQPPKVERRGGVLVERVDACRRLSLYRLVLDPGAEAPLELDGRPRQDERVLSPGLVSAGRALPVGHRSAMRRAVTAPYQNSSASPAGLLCLDAAPIDPPDERLLPGVGA